MESRQEMNTGEYLSRIGIATDLAANADTLNILQRQHLLSVPFENLDIHWGRPIVLDSDKIF